MTDTDLIPAGDAIESTALPTTVTPDVTPAASNAGGSGSLTSMVLPELRALAGKLGVKGASGMRKGDLIAAIRERQTATPKADSATSGEPQNGTPPAEASDASAEPARRERRGASRDAGAPREGQSDKREGQSDKTDAPRADESGKSDEAKSGERADNNRQGRDGDQQNRNNNTNNANNNAGDDDGEGRHQLSFDLEIAQHAH